MFYSVWWRAFCSQAGQEKFYPENSREQQELLPIPGPGGLPGFLRLVFHWLTFSCRTTDPIWKEHPTEHTVQYTTN